MLNEVLERARELGREAGENAASWACDAELWGHAELRSLVDDIDPEVMDKLRGFCPNLSGEWAGDPTPATLADDIGIRHDDIVLDDACTAWEDAAWETLQDIVNAWAVDTLSS